MSGWVTNPTAPWHQDMNILGDQIFGSVVLANRLTGAVYRVFLFLVNGLHGTCASSLATTQLVHVRWDTTSFCPHCQTAPETDFG
jgi:hypothetical protein